MIILPRDANWSDEYVWEVPTRFIERGGVDCGFVNWCRGNFTHDWRFKHLSDGWVLIMTHEDDYTLLTLRM